jgi:phytoene synthase
MNDADREPEAYCADLVRTHDFGRYAATLFVPSDQRRALLALYAFNVEISRVSEQVSQPLPGEVRLRWWTDVLAGEGRGGIEGNPVAAELLSAVRHFGMPVEPLSRLVDEHEFDLYNDPMPTLAALEGYLTETSAALFGLAACVAGPPSAELDHLARHAGLAQGFAEVIASLPRTAARRQLFLPEQLLEAHGSRAEEIFSGRQTLSARGAVNQLLAEARQHLSTAAALLAEASPEIRRVFLPLALVRRDLRQLSRADNDPFSSYTPSRFSTLWTLWRASKSRLYRGG